MKNQKIIRSLSVVLIFVLAMSLLPTTTLATQNMGTRVTDFTEGEYTFRSALGNFMVDTNGGEPWTEVHLWQTVPGNSNQVITIVCLENGYYGLRAASGRFLDAKGGETTNNTRIITYNWNGHYNMQWAIFERDDGTHVFQNRRSGRVLDVSGAQTANATPIVLFDFNGTNAQRFHLEPLNAPEMEVSSLCESAVRVTNFPSGNFSIHSSLSGNLALDINGGNNWDRVHLKEIVSSSNEQWIQIESIGNDFFRLRTASNRFLDAEGGATAAGTRVISFDWNGDLNMQWKLYRFNDGSFAIVNRSSSLVLDVQGANANNGVIQLYPFNSTAAQRWFINEVSVSEPTHESTPEFIPEPLPEFIPDSVQPPHDSQLTQISDMNADRCFDTDFCIDAWYARYGQFDAPPSDDYSNEREGVLGDMQLFAAATTTTAHATGTWLWPVPEHLWISSPFGQRARGWHNGLDIVGSSAGVVRNARIVATRDGVVVANGWSNANGNWVRIRHANNYYSTYLHLIQRSPLAVNTRVNAGDTIGHVGRTGSATGYHLCFRLQRRISGNLRYLNSNPRNRTELGIRVHTNSSTNVNWNGVTYTLSASSPAPPSLRAPRITLGGAIANYAMPFGGGPRINVEDIGQDANTLRVWSRDANRYIYNSDIPWGSGGIPFSRHHTFVAVVERDTDTQLNELRNLPVGRYRVTAIPRRNGVNGPASYVEFSVVATPAAQVLFTNLNVGQTIESSSRFTVRGTFQAGDTLDISLRNVNTGASMLSNVAISGASDGTWSFTLPALQAGNQYRIAVRSRRGNTEAWSQIDFRTSSPTQTTPSIHERHIGEARWTTRNVNWFHDNALSRSAGTLQTGTMVRTLSVLTITENGRTRVVARVQSAGGGATRYIDPVNLTATFSSPRSGSRFTTADWSGIYPTPELRSGTAFAIVPRNTRVEARAVIFSPASNFEYRAVARVTLMDRQATYGQPLSEHRLRSHRMTADNRAVVMGAGLITRSFALRKPLCYTQQKCSMV